MADDFLPHRSLAKLQGSDMNRGVVEINGFVAPSSDKEMVEIWNELDGDIRMHVPREVITDSRKDEDGRIHMTVPADAQIQVTQRGWDTVEASLLAGLTEEVLHPEAMAQGIAQINATKGKTTKDVKKCKKFCRTLPWWKCAASTIVIITANICTQTWPCDTSSD